MTNIRASLAFTLAQQYGCAAIALVSVIILAHLLTPEEVGIYSVSAAVVGIAHMLRDLGVGRYLVQERDLTVERLRTAFGIGVATAWICAAAMFFGRGSIAEFYGDERLRQVFAVLSGNFLLIPFGAPILWILTREMKFGQLFMVNIASQLVQSVTSIALAFLGFTFMSMAWASLAGAFTTTFLASLLDVRHLFVRPSFKEWRRILGFGVWASGQTLALELGNSAGDLILGRTLGFEAVAIYSRASGLIATIYRDILKAVAVVAFPAFADAHRRDTDLRGPYVRGTAHVIGITWPIIALFGITAYPLIHFLFGANWMGAAPVLQIFCLIVPLGPVVMLANQLLIARGEVKLYFRIEVTIQSLRVAMILLGSLYGLQAVAALQVVPAIAAVIMWLHFTRKVTGIEARTLLYPCVQGLGITLLSAIGPLAVGFMARGQNDFVVLAASGILWGAGWLTGVLALRHPLSEELQRMLSLIFGTFAAMRPKRH